MSVKTRKQPRSEYVVSSKKIPVENENAESYFTKHPVWRFMRCDNEHDSWSVQNNCDFNNNLMNRLIDFEGLTWQEIISASGGKKSGSNSHFIEVYKLSKSAQKRLEELNIFEDQLFSLRLTGKERLFGVLINGIFHILWYDNKHEICPVKKRNT